MENNKIQILGITWETNKTTISRVKKKGVYKKAEADTIINRSKIICQNIPV